jgi:predicted DNA binding CopG/RHH family protein
MKRGCIKVATRGRANKIKPQFDTVEEMADFFDKVDSTKLAWEDTDLKVERPKMVQISIRIPEEDLNAIRRKARKIGLGHTSLIRMMLRRSLYGDAQTEKTEAKGHS